MKSTDECILLVFFSSVTLIYYDLLVFLSSHRVHIHSDASRTLKKKEEEKRGTHMYLYEYIYTVLLFYKEAGRLENKRRQCLANHG